MKSNNTPVYELGNPFDNIKIILNTLIGYDRSKLKFNYCEKCNAIIAKDKNSINLFRIDLAGTSFGLTDPEYSESAIVTKKFVDNKQYGKLFYTYGSELLTLIANTVLRKNFSSTKMNNMNLLLMDLQKLSVAFENHYYNFNKLIGGYTFENPEIKKYNKLRFTAFTLFDDLYHIYEIVTKKEGTTTYEFGEILAITYTTLTILLTGILINFSETLGLNLNTLYDDGASEAINTFADRLISASNIDTKVKYKIISIFYLYHYLTKFYENSLSIEMDSSLAYPFIKIGEKISKLDIKVIEEELDINFLTQEEITNNTEASSNNPMNLMSYLKGINIIKDFAEFDSFLELNDDFSDKLFMALFIYKYFTRFDYTIKNGMCNFFNAFVDVGTITKTDVDLLYNHFIDNVGNRISSLLNPNYFYKVTVYAAAFRYIINKSNDESIKEQASAGLYQAEGILGFICKRFFCTEGLCEFTENINCPSPAYNYKKLKAILYVDCVINEYKMFIESLSNEKGKINSTYENYYNHFLEIKTDFIDVANSDYEKPSDIINRFKKGHIYPLTDAEKKKHIEELNKNEMSYQEYVFEHNFFSNEKDDIIKTIESEFNDLAMNTIVSYDNDRNNYNTIHDCRLGRLFVNNIKEIMKKENTDNIGEMYVNIFVKFVISEYLANENFAYDNASNKLVKMDKDDLQILPNITSTNKFNFIERR